MCLRCDGAVTAGVGGGPVAGGVFFVDGLFDCGSGRRLEIVVPSP